MDNNHTVAVPLFSIIVPIYKTEQYLDQCLQSIARQTFEDFEVIMVDDGSPDKSGEICDRYVKADSRFHVIHKKNGGLVSARKAGAKACKGKYVVSIDSDDYVALDLLKTLADCVQAHRPQAVLFDLMQFSEQGEIPLRKMVEPGLYAGEKMQMIRDNLIQNEKGEQTLLYNLASMAVQRELYEPHQMAVPEKISRGEDLVVTTPLLVSCERVYLLDYIGYFYRTNPTSIMNTFNTREMEQNKMVVSYLSSVLGEKYDNKVCVYMLAHYFDFLDRGMLRGGYRDYMKLVRKTLDKEVLDCIQRARCKGNLKIQVIYALVQRRCFTLLWLLRRIKSREE